MCETPLHDREQQIRARAFGLYEWRRLTGHDGTAESDWLTAERDLRTEDELIDLPPDEDERGDRARDVAG